VYGDEIQFFLFFNVMPQMVCGLNQMVEELGQDVSGGAAAESAVAVTSGELVAGTAAE
jgi:hypothetical protein